jgi:Flp pilus assembly protein TadD
MLLRLVFYLNQKGDSGSAVNVLSGLIEKYPAYADAYLLLGGIYEEQGKKSEAREMVGNAFGVEGIPDQVKQRIGA